MRSPEQARAAREHAQAALTLVEGLLAADPHNPEFRLEQARGLRWSWLAADGPDAAGADFARAVAVLRELIAEFPAADVYVAELVETYALLAPRSAAQPEVLAQVEAAYENAQQLVRAHPTVPAYRASQARLASVLADALLSSDAPAARGRVERVLQDAVRLHGELASRPTPAPLHVFLLGNAQVHLAAVVHRREGAAAARDLLLTFISEHEGRLRDRGAARPMRARILPPLLDELADCYRELGDAEAAKAAEARREALRPPR